MLKLEGWMDIKLLSQQGHSIRAIMRITGSRSRSLGESLISRFSRRKVLWLASSLPSLEILAPTGIRFRDQRELSESSQGCARSKVAKGTGVELLPAIMQN
jgi:hypothetical protein